MSTTCPGILLRDTGRAGKTNGNVRKAFCGFCPGLYIKKGPPHEMFSSCGSPSLQPNGCYSIFQLFIVHFRQLSRLVCSRKTVYDFFQITVQHTVQTMQCQFDPVICHTSLGEIIGSDLLRAVPGTHLASSGFCLLVVALLQLHLIQSGTKHLKRFVFVLEL